MFVDIYNTDKKYEVVYADPPWYYNDKKSHDPSMGGITYPTMTDEEIAQMPIKEIVAKDALLFIWVTMPKLPVVFPIIESWGFSYVTCAFVWVKQNRNGRGIYSGLGNWVNGNAELCLLAKRGTPKRYDKSVKQIISSPLREHSRKPDEVRERVVRLAGNKTSKLELFARADIQGWDVYGNEIDGIGAYTKIDSDNIAEKVKLFD